MWPFKWKCDGKHHRWSSWDYAYVNAYRVYYRSCKCGAIQRHNTRTGEVTIWSPDGVDSGLLDKGITRRIYEDL